MSAVADYASQIFITTRAFLHHLGSFLFVQDPYIIMISTIWRTVSMFGHSLLLFRSHPSYKFWNKTASYARLVVCGSCLVLCLIDARARKGFAASAVGHISYMIVRASTIFHCGSLYLTGTDKESWPTMSDAERLRTLLAGRHKLLSFEIILLLSFSGYLLFLRYGSSII